MSECSKIRTPSHTAALLAMRGIARAKQGTWLDRPERSVLMRVVSVLASDLASRDAETTVGEATYQASRYDRRDRR